MTEKIAAVIDSFDEEGRQPGNYVVELADGGFEARVWDLNNECELTLGTCANLGEATGMVWAYADQIRWLMEWFPGPKEYLRPN
jgi:hypothetical protein